MNNKMISIVIPVYNMEKYLKRCLDSVINQTYDNLEILLINDGSTDKSRNICNEYVKKDKRIKLINQDNGGLSAARNTGIDNMTGEYVAFIDSDDFVSNLYVENLYKAISSFDADIACSDYVKYYEGDKVHDPIPYNEQKTIEYDKGAFIRDALYSYNVNVHAWGKLYRASLFENVRFPVGEVFEDLPTIIEVLPMCQKIVYIPNKDYRYFRRSNSISNKPFTINNMYIVSYIENLEDVIYKNYNSAINAYYSRLFRACSLTVMTIKPGSFVDIRKNLWRMVRKYRFYVLFSRKANRENKFLAFLSLFGYSFTYKVFHSMQKKRS